MISEVATKVLEALQEAVPHLKVMDEAEAKAGAAKSLLDSTLSELEQAKASLAKTNTDLAKANEDLKSKRHLIDDEHARALRDVQKQIADGQQKVRELEEETRKKQVAHDGVVAGMDALHKRLYLGQ